MSFQILRGELKSIGVKQVEVADLLGMTNSNFNRKLAEAVPFTRDEMFAIRDRYFPGVTIDYLFQSDGDKPTRAESLHAQVEAMGDEMRRAKPGDGEIAEIEGAFHECVDEWERQYPDRAVETA